MKPPMPASTTHPGHACLIDGYEIFWATPDVAAGSMPCRPEHLALLKEQGLGAVLNLCAECRDLPEFEREHGLEVRYLPIDDMGVPEITALDEALSWLEAHLARGMKVFIHCRYGMGRTGTVLACWLARRGICLTPGPGWRAKPASPEQRRFVKDYLKQLGIDPPHNGLWERIMHCLFGH